jgi:hypothetical protein
MSASTTTNPVSSSPKRTWRRFTLRALFLVVLAAGIFFGWVAYRVRHFEEQEAQEARKKGQVHYFGFLGLPRGRSVDSRPSRKAVACVQ